MTGKNRGWVLESYPVGDDFDAALKLRDTPMPEPGPNQMLVRSLYLSLDPYMRGRMNDSKSYATPQPLNEVMIGGAAGEVVESKHPSFAVGDKVTGLFGWQTFGTSDGRGVTKVDDTRVPLSAYLGAVGMPGVTAWYGLNGIIAPKTGETVVVSVKNSFLHDITLAELQKLWARPSSQPTSTTSGVPRSSGASPRPAARRSSSSRM